MNTQHSEFSESVKRMHNFYSRKENAPIYQEEFGFLLS